MPKGHGLSLAVLKAVRDELQMNQAMKADASIAKLKELPGILMFPEIMKMILNEKK